MGTADEIISRDLFQRSRDTDWDTVYEICCGRRLIAELPAVQQPVIDLFIGDQLSGKSMRRHLKTLFSMAIECYETRAEEEPVIKVFVFLLSLLDLDIKLNGQQTVRFGDNGIDCGLKTKLQVLTQTLQLLAQRFHHLSLAKSFDLSSFVAKVLDENSAEDIDEQVLVDCFGLIVELDYELIAGHPTLMRQMLIRCNPKAEESAKLNAKRNHVFITLFDVYFKAKKGLKLHELLSELSAELSPQLIHTSGQLSRLYGRSILGLPFGQTLELWSLFLRQFNPKHHFWTNLLTQFLRHIRCLDDSIPQQYVPLTTGLLVDTRNVLRTTLQYLTADDEELAENLLELYIAFGSVIIWRMNYNRNDLSLQEKWSYIQRTPNEWYDLSLVYEFAEDYDWKQMFDAIDSLSPTLRGLLLKSLCQKFQIWKCLQLNGNLSDDQKSVVATSVDQLLTAMITNFCNDLHLFRPQDVMTIINDLSRKNISLLADSLMENAVIAGNGAEDIDNKTTGFDVRRLLLGSVWENTTFQTAFVSAFWQQISACFGHKKKRKHDVEEGLVSVNTIFESLTSKSSVWFKYAAQSPPKAANKENKMWSILADVCRQTEELIHRPDWPEKAKVSAHLLEMFLHCVPLEYLLPANQMRCLLCLSLVMFSLDLTLEKNVLIMDLILDSILRIFDGVRSVWFFRYVNPSLYLIHFLKCVRNYPNHEKLRQFVTKLTDNFGRNRDQSIELKAKLAENEDKLSLELLIMSETILLKSYLRVLNMTSVPKYLLPVKEICETITHELSNTIHGRLKRHLSADPSTGGAVESLDSVLIVDSFAAVFEFQVSKTATSEETVHLKTRWRKLLAKLIDISVNQLMAKSTNECCVKFLVLLCNQRKKLANILPEEFAMNLIQVLCPAEEDAKRPEDTLTGVKLTDVWTETERFADTFDEIEFFADLNRSRFLATISAQNAFAESVGPLIVALIKCSSRPELERLVQMLMSLLKSQDYLYIAYSLSLWLAVFDSDFHQSEENRRLFADHLTELLTLCSIHCQTCNQNDTKLTPEFQLHIKVPALKTVRSILHVMSSQTALTSAHVSLGLQTCADARLGDYHSAPELFVHLFDCIYGVLNELLLQHKSVAIASVASTHTLIADLMRALMTVSAEQRFVDYEPPVRHELEICSKNMDRLLTLTAGLGADYAVFAPHLMAAYVSHTERVSVHAVVKKNVMSGMNRLLKVMSGADSNAVEMLYSRFTDSKRQIFKLIFDNFDKYYKFKGQI